MKYRFSFSMAEVSQLLSYVEARSQGADAGWYYGSKGQFEQREQRIKAELNNVTRSTVGKQSSELPK